MTGYHEKEGTDARGDRITSLAHELLGGLAAFQRYRRVIEARLKL